VFLGFPCYFVVMVCDLHCWLVDFVLFGGLGVLIFVGVWWFGCFLGYLANFGVLVFLANFG